MIGQISTNKKNVEEKFQKFSSEEQTSKKKCNHQHGLDSKGISLFF
jgi:hypothetical protein